MLLNEMRCPTAGNLADTSILPGLRSKCGRQEKHCSGEAARVVNEGV